MAITLCDSHSRGQKPFVRDGIEIAGFVTPLGYPNSAVICSVSNCSNPAWVGLEQHEVDALKQNKQTEFTSPDGWVKLKI